MTGRDSTAIASATLEAARARAAGGVLTAAGAGAVTGMLDGGVWRVVRRRADGREVSLLTCPPEYAPASDDPEVASMPPTRAKVLLGVLAATRIGGAAHPWPGADTDVAAVLRLLGGPRVPVAIRRHYLGSFRDLATARLVELPGHDTDGPLGQDTRVRIGPAVAAWDGPWLEQVATLADRLAGAQGRGTVRA